MFVAQHVSGGGDTQWSPQEKTDVKRIFVLSTAAGGNGISVQYTRRSKDTTVYLASLSLAQQESIDVIDAGAALTVEPGDVLVITGDDSYEVYID